jgi:hypothetical protein
MPQAPLDADVAGSAIKVAQAFEQAKVPYAIGGAIALTMYGFVRATRDAERSPRPGSFPLRKGPVETSMLAAIETCRGDRIRTCDPLLPKQVLYQAEPLPELVTGSTPGAPRL